MHFYWYKIHTKGTEDITVLDWHNEKEVLGATL